MTTTIESKLNGVDVEALTETMGAIEKEPTLARFEFRARNRWIDGGHNRSTIDGFYGAGREDDSRAEPFVFDNDEPPILLGENRGANPVEFLLHAMAGCITTTFVYYAAAEGVKVDGVETTFSGDIDIQGLLGLSDEVPVGYGEIRIDVKVDADAPEAKIRELVELAKNRSPVVNTVRNATPVKVHPVKG